MRKLCMLLAVVFCFAVGGVYATWKYGGLPVEPKDQELPISLVAFDFPEQVLPGGGEVDAEMGENHFYLIWLILWEDVKDYGLNVSSSSPLHNFLKNNDYLHCNQKMTGGNAKFVVNPSDTEDTDNLYYCLEYVSSTKYYCYTFSIADLEREASTKGEIPVYRTTLEVVNGEWDDTTSVSGYANVEKMGVGSLPSAASQYRVKYSIDPETWYPAQKEA